MINSIEVDPHPSRRTVRGGHALQVGRLRALPLPHVGLRTDLAQVGQGASAAGISPASSGRTARCPDCSTPARNSDCTSAPMMGTAGCRFQYNLPQVPITDLALKDNDLIVATQGRSFWVLDDLDVLWQSMEEPLEAGALRLFDPHPTVGFGGGSGKASPTQGTNHPRRCAGAFSRSGRGGAGGADLQRQRRGCHSRVCYGRR